MVVRRRPLAADDIAQALDHIAEDSLRAADRWIDPFPVRMQASIEADLQRDPRWAVFLIERVRGGLVDARIAKDLR